MSAGDRRVLIKPVRPASEGVRCDLIGEDQLTGGVAVWNTVDRPRRRAGVEWAGTSGYTYVLPLLIAVPDGDQTVRPGDRVTHAGAAVEGDCRRLRSWASKATRKTREPCVVRIAGPLRAPDATRWVITGLEWGTQIRDSNGRRIQQAVTVTLTEWVQAEVKRSPAKHARDTHDDKD